MKILSQLSIITLFMMAFQCKEEATPTGGELSGDWKFKTYQSSGSPAAFAATLKIASDGNPAQITGRSSVNSYFGTCRYDKTAGTITFSGLGSTKMAGSMEAMAFEAAYFQNLQNATKYSVNSAGELLISLSSPANEAMVFQK